MSPVGQLFCSSYIQKIDELKQQVHSLESKLFHLQEINEKLTYMVRALSQGIFTVDTEGMIDFWSHGMESLLSVPFAEALGKKYTHFFPQIKTFEYDPLSEITVGKRKLKLTVEKEIQAGTATNPSVLNKEFELTFLPMHNEIGNFIGTVVEVWDVSDRKKYQEMQLDFVAVVTHELRTPASTIKGYLSLLLDEDDNLSEDQQKFIRRAYISNERQIQTIESLLTASKIERDSVTVELEDLQIEPIIADVIKVMREEAKAKGLELRMNYPQFALPRVFADASYVRQVMYSLVSNAVKYTEQGWIEVGYATSTDTVTVSVKDTGSGIPEQLRNKIFSRFTRGERPLTEQTQGLGLGLYSAKIMVEKMNGTISFETAEGQGTTFYVTLPITSKKAPH